MKIHVLYNKKKRMEEFQKIPINKRGRTLLHLSKKIRESILHELHNDQIIDIIRFLDPYKATRLLNGINSHRQKTILTKLSQQMRESIEFLLTFAPATAGELINLDYLELETDTKISEVIKLLERHTRETGHTPTLLITSEGFLLGELPIHYLALGRKNEKVIKYLKRIPAIKHDRPHHDVIKVFKKHRHGKIIVLNHDKSILGVIYSDDILRLVETQAAKSLREFAGIKEEEDVLDSGLSKVQFRYKWLIINLFTAFLAASVVGLFEDTISKYVLLAAYLPIVAGMGGNAATQTLAVTVRGIALKEIDISRGKKVILNEVYAGAINGVITGLLAAVIALLWNKSAMLGLVIGLAMVFNLIVAGFAGTIIPLIMKKLGKDPASSATIFITTATDIFGFLAFLGLATILL